MQIIRDTIEFRGHVTRRARVIFADGASITLDTPELLSDAEAEAKALAAAMPMAAPLDHIEQAALEAELEALVNE